MKGWLERSGAVGLDALELADFPDTGRGLKALQQFKEGERILTIPSDILWTVEHAYADPLLGPALRSARPPLSVDDTLAVYILFVRSRESGYDGPRSHLAAVPQSYSASIFFSDDELEVCAGTSLYGITKQLRQCIQEDYKELVVRLLIRHRDLFPISKFTIEDYKWALCTVWSRAMDFVLPGEKSLRLMAPFADMLNHSSDVKQCHAYDPSTGNLSILAGKDYEVGDQVFIYYGPIANNRLLRLYGFVIPDNPNDNYELVLQTHAAAPFYEQKSILWELTGLDSTSTIPLTLTDPLPKKVLQYLRIQRLDEEEINAMAHRQKEKNYDMITKPNEIIVLKSLVESFSEILNSFGTQLEELEAQLASGVYSVGGNAWAAAHVSLGEQRVLRLARKRAKDMLTSVKSGSADTQRSLLGPTRCENCGNDSVPLMACGRCRAAMYCGRACQVAHYKEHKAHCPRGIPENGFHTN